MQLLYFSIWFLLSLWTGHQEQNQKYYSSNKNSLLSKFNLSNNDAKFLKLLTPIYNKINIFLLADQY